MTAWLTFLLVMALGQFAPGPDMLLLTRTALSRGKAAGIAMAGGVASGLMFHAALALSGVATVLSQGGWLSTALSVVACGYLLWMGWQLFQSARAGAVIDWDSAEKPPDLSLWNHWWRGFLCNMLNPKVALFLAGMVTPFLAVRSEAWWPWLLWLSIWVEGLILWSLWVTLLQHGGARRRYAAIARWIDGGFALLLWGMAVLLIWRALVPA